jgi:hypothetical protein
MPTKKRVSYREVAGWKDLNTTITVNDDGSQSADTETIMMCALFQIRDELQRLNTLLHCHNFTDIPHKLERIKKNTTKKRKPRAVGKPKLRVVGRS